MGSLGTAWYGRRSPIPLPTAKEFLFASCMGSFLICRTSHVVTLLFCLVVNLTAMGQTAKLAVCSPSTAAASACPASTRPSLPAPLHAFIPLGVAHLLLRRAAKGRSSRPANGFLQEIPNPELCRNGFSPHVIIIRTPSERPSPSPSPWNKVQAIAMEGSSHVQGRVTMQRRATPTPKATSRSTAASLLQPDAMPWKAKQHLHIGGYKNILYFETEDSRVMVATMV